MAIALLKDLAKKLPLDEQLKALVDNINLPNLVPKDKELKGAGAVAILMRMVNSKLDNSKTIKPENGKITAASLIRQAEALLKMDLDPHQNPFSY